MRIVLVSHCNFLGNSAMHVFSIAEQLTLFGHEVAMLVPDGVETVERHRPPSFMIRLYSDAISGSLGFKDGAEPDLVHAWTPREHVRKITLHIAAQFKCPYMVHMEDNEEQITTDELVNMTFKDVQGLPSIYQDILTNDYRSHPTLYREFVERAQGYTCLIDGLLEFKPAGLPGLVFWPGFDPEFEDIAIDRTAVRERYGIAESDIVLLYSGNVHHSVVGDVRNLYLAVAYLRARGSSVRLLRTGWNHASLDIPIELLSDCVTDLGFVDRSEVPALLGLADLLVQPGKSDSFNDYRFPSKLPEYLVSGKPVILPASNIGNALEDGVHVLKLFDGTLIELISKIERLVEDTELSLELGKRSREFALENLRWWKAARAVEDLYKRVLSSKTADSQLPSAALRPVADEHPVKVVAFYLPQFHPIAENNSWWGKGFTEWTNVARAEPQLFAHRHPRLPTELGYYDLRRVEVMHEQASLAADFGIGGFCFYAYWFEGKRLLETPLNQWLQNGPDFPFCICWANENWSRRWDGSERDILIAQDYSDGFEERFIADMAPILKDPRYIRVDGAPLLSIYRVSEFPDPIASARALREAAAKNGIPNLHLTIIQSFGLSDPRPYGFDAAIEFSPPHVGRLLLNAEHIGGVAPSFAGHVEDYVGVAASSINSTSTDYVRYRGCFPMWDNTARRGNKGHVFVNDSPKAYAQWLRFLVNEAMARRREVEPLIFINAWNEWAEGAYLEPDHHYGRDLLEVTKAAIAHGVADFAQGGAPDEREREFTHFVSRLPRTK